VVVTAATANKMMAQLVAATLIGAKVEAVEKMRTMTIPTMTTNDNGGVNYK
jgi:hypothetical protein